MKLLKRIKETKVIQWIIYHYNSIHNTINLKLKSRKADRLHKLTGKRYFVVPATDTTLMVVNNDYVKHYNKHSGQKKITFHDLIKMAYYYTSTRPPTKKA